MQIKAKINMDSYCFNINDIYFFLQRDLKFLPSFLPSFFKTLAADDFDVFQEENIILLQTTLVFLKEFYKQEKNSREATILSCL